MLKVRDGSVAFIHSQKGLINQLKGYNHAPEVNKIFTSQKFMSTGYNGGGAGGKVTKSQALNSTPEL